MHTKTILVVGGAGYIGSHMTLLLKQNGYEPIVLDNLSTGHAHAVLDAELIFGDIRDKKILTELFRAYDFKAVMHFASLINVAESVSNPAIYYHNNVIGTLNLLDVMIKHQVNHFLFSSSASVYGEPQYLPINENHPLNPINPYGKSKYMVEQIILDYALAYGLKYAILRYFNAAGADPLCRLGERHKSESHLIPLILKVAMGEEKEIVVNGSAYKTHDGTCVRDYIHINDICTAHLCALHALENNKEKMIYNLGIGRGYSVNEIITAAEFVTSKKINYRAGLARAGDPAVLIADASLAKNELNWQAEYTDINTIIKHAWNYMLAQ